MFGKVLYGWLKSAAQHHGPSRKVPVYVAIIALVWSLSGILYLLIHRHSIALSDLGEGYGHPQRTIVALAALLAIFSILVVQNVRQLERTDPVELDKGLGKGKSFYPVSRIEIAFFILLALSTGICEELIFRGWLVSFLGAFTHSIWIGVVLASVAFGFGHAHQGPKGMMITGLLGLIFGVIFVVTSSLICVQVIHVAINLANGLVGAYAMSLLNASTSVRLSAA